MTGNVLIAVFIKSATLDDVIVVKGPTISLAPFAILGSVPFLGGWSIRTASIPVLPRHVASSFGDCTRLGLIGSDFLIVFINKEFLMFSRLWREILE
jgi:hypothetical protein